MKPIRTLALLGTTLALALSLGGCLIGGGSNTVSTVGARTYYQLTFFAKLTTCVPTPLPPDGSTVTCSLQVPTGQSLTMSVNLPGIAPASLPALFDPLIVQVPIGMGNFGGYFTGPGGGSLAVTPVTGTLYADANTPIVAEPGYQLVLVDFAPGASPVSGANYEYHFSFYTDSPPPPVITVKAIFAGKVTTAAAAAVGSRVEKASTTYYPPLLPCSANFATIPGVNLSGSTYGVIPLAAATMACNNVTYNVGGATAGTVAVIEYRNSDFDHYFVTPNLSDIQLLDAKTPPFQAWSRTGRSFKAYPNAGAPAGSVAVCRFFNSNFGSKSSHFFALHGFGCEDTINFFPDWTLEYENYFNTMLPDMNSACAAGTVPLYRLYNQGMGGAPNHRFVTALVDQQDMVNQGWANEGVRMCLPQ